MINFFHFYNIVEAYAADKLSLNIINSKNLDPFFKGDIDGTNIWISPDLTPEEKLFNSVHLVGHCIQWGTKEEYVELGSVLHLNPDKDLLFKLQRYEWEANCYGLGILHVIGHPELGDWLFEKYREDIIYLTNFYVTGEKVKQVTDVAMLHPFVYDLVPMQLPEHFTPVKIEGSRNGIVI